MVEYNQIGFITIIFVNHQPQLYRYLILATIFLDVDIHPVCIIGWARESCGCPQQINSYIVDEAVIWALWFGVGKGSATSTFAFFCKIEKRCI